MKKIAFMMVAAVMGMVVVACTDKAGNNKPQDTLATDSEQVVSADSLKGTAIDSAANNADSAKAQAAAEPAAEAQK